MDAAAEERWIAHLDGTLHRPGTRRHVLAMSLVPELVLGLLSAATNTAYTPMAQLPRSISRIRRRLQRGKAVTLELRWTDTKLSPEGVKVVLQSESAILRRSFQPEVDLRTAGHPIEFMGFPLPPNLAAEPDRTWLKLATPGGTRYLGGRESELALIGVCARWPYPVTRE